VAQGYIQHYQVEYTYLNLKWRAEESALQVSGRPKKGIFVKSAILFSI